MGPIDPVILATTTTALTHLALKVYEGTISAATKDLWERVKNKFQWKNDPPKEQLASDIANKLKDDDVLLKELMELLKSNPEAGGDASTLVGQILAEKVVVAQTIHTKEFNM